MRSTLRAIVAGGIMTAATVLPLGAAAHAAPAAGAGVDAPATAQGEVGTAATWRLRGPYSSYSACERARDSLAGLGYATQPCFYRECGTAPNCRNGWHFRIWI